MPIILRLTKGAELTFAELDGNFTDLDNRLDGIEEANLISRVTRLEQAGTPIYFDSDDVMVMLDSIWGGIGDSGNFLATTDSIGLASFDSSRFSVDSGHVSWIERLATIDSDGTASFDSEDFVVTNGHVTINPNSPGGRVAGITPIDSTGVASFADADFNVTTDGHVTLTDSAVRTRISAIDNGGAGSFTYNETLGTFAYDGPSLATTSTVGVASFSSSDFSVNGSGQVSLAGGSGIPVSSGITSIGSFMFVQTNGMPNGTKYAPGANIPGSQLRYGKLANGVFSLANVGFIRAPGTGTTRSIEAPQYSGSNNSSNTLPGTWRNCGPGVVGYIDGSGSSTYCLAQRVS